ncbi:hypothetical protein KFK09_021397 [Dendrobium nobile]|uniref:NAC domain-containing protein n=1 Tax=Dendrobium nobile TaxID=94219 RepID=A0A8T3ANK0_DENNO|nr:hypothetical protein KFK09_021397 [Dendrobium nobile]
MAVEEDGLVLPPGFRFHPSDEEIITHYLSPKVLNHGFRAIAMGEIDLNKCEPWDLPSKAKMTGEKEWYFFYRKDRKYPTGMRTNRATESGYWKATGKDKEIYRGRVVLVGMKKTLVFYRGRAPKGEKTNWVMHEYRLDGKASLSNFPRSAKDEWVVCRVLDKNTGLKKSPMHGGGIIRVNSVTDEFLHSPKLPPLMDTAFINSGAASSTPIMPSYFFSSTTAGGVGEDVDGSLYPSKNQYMMNDPSSSSSYLHQLHGAHDQNPYFSSMLDQDPQVMIQSWLPAIWRHCKVGQFSNQSMLSQDTGISTDRNTEISSVISKHDLSYDQDLVAPPAVAADDELDLQSMWRC